uniref:Uncharacterized protein n=1 Tax=Panagrellus redivivus TaxID=6233 RepID=A0A7E4V0T8_PANRE
MTPRAFGRETKARYTMEGRRRDGTSRPQGEKERQAPGNQHQLTGCLELESRLEMALFDFRGSHCVWLSGIQFSSGSGRGCLSTPGLGLGLGLGGIVMDRNGVVNVKVEAICNNAAVYPQISSHFSCPCAYFANKLQSQPQPQLSSRSRPPDGHTIPACETIRETSYA